MIMRNDIIAMSSGCERAQCSLQDIQDKQIWIDI